MDKMNVFLLLMILFVINNEKYFAIPIEYDDDHLDELINEIFNIPLSEPETDLSANDVSALIQRQSQDQKNNEDKICKIGECVPFHLCVNNSIITDGEGLISIRMQKNADNGNDPTRCLFTEVCCGSDEIDSNTELSDELPECGHRNVGIIQSRITGEDFAEYTEFPWMIAIFQKITNSQKYRYLCGGSLIHPAVVLTAAHCVQSLNRQILKIRGGEWDTENTNEKWPHQDRDVREIAIHNQYNRRSLHNDIALLFLETPLKIGSNIDSICLPTQNYRFVHSDRCFVSGWGKDEYGKNGKFPKILKKTELPIVSRNLCQILLRKTILGKYFKLHHSFMCAGGEEGNDACYGDGGSPLVCEIPGLPNRFYQAGIVSWGIGCQSLHIPGVYVNIAAFRVWIDKHFKIRNIDTSYYTVQYTLRPKISKSFKINSN